MCKSTCGPWNYTNYNRNIRQYQHIFGVVVDDVSNICHSLNNVQINLWPMELYKLQPLYKTLSGYLIMQISSRPESY